MCMKFLSNKMLGSCLEYIYQSNSVYPEEVVEYVRLLSRSVFTHGQKTQIFTQEPILVLSVRMRSLYHIWRFHSTKMNLVCLPQLCNTFIHSNLQLWQQTTEHLWLRALFKEPTVWWWWFSVMVVVVDLTTFGSAAQCLNCNKPPPGSTVNETGRNVKSPQLC